MTIMPYLPMLMGIGYLVLIILLVVFIIVSVKKYLDLKKEQNDLLRDIIQKMNVK